MARTNTYLNFPNKTEEAFNFYKSVFKTEFGSNGIQRFGDMPENPEAPLTDEQKQLVMHVQLPIVGGHVLMGTDAPESMGFNVLKGNNIFLSLEPDTKKETKRLFDELSKEGTVSMPIGDQFWGYFGSCTDKFGVQWMFNFTEQKG